MASISGTPHSRQYVEFKEAFNAFRDGVNQRSPHIDRLFQSAQERYEALSPSTISDTHCLSRVISVLRQLWERVKALFCCYQIVQVSAEERSEIQKDWESLQQAYKVLRLNPVVIPPSPSRGKAPYKDPLSTPVAPKPTPAPRASPVAPAASVSKIAVGIKNAGNNCWCNAFLQLMMHTPQIRQAYERVANALAEDEPSQIRMAEECIRKQKEQCQLEDDALLKKYNHLPQSIVESRINAARSAMTTLRPLNQKETFKVLFERKFKPAPDQPLPSIEIPPQEDQLPEVIFQEAFSQYLNTLLPAIFEMALPHLINKPKTLATSLDTLCLIAMRIAWTQASAATELPEKQRRALAKEAMSPMIHAHVAALIEAHPEDLLGPPPQPVSRAHIQSVEKTQASIREHGQHLKEVITRYEAGLVSHEPLPESISQNVRLAFHFLSPKNINPNKNRQEDAQEAFAILNTTYDFLFKENPPYALQATVHRTYHPHPTEELPEIARTNPKDFEARKMASLAARDNPLIPPSMPSNRLFSFLEEDHQITSEDTRFELQLSWEKPASSKTKISFETLFKNYFSQTYPVSSQEQPSAYMQPNGEVRSFVKIGETVSIEAPEEGFMVMLKRFDRCPRTGQLLKKTDPIEMPTRIELSERTYTLMNIVEHVSGTSSTQSGHYVDYLKDPETNQWYLANDSRVSHCTSKEIQTARKVGYLFYYARKV